MRPYPKYSESGVEWIGEIPEHWIIKKLKYIAKIVTGNTPSKNDSSNYSENGMSWIKPDNLNCFKLLTESKEYLSASGVKLARILPKYSILVCCIGSIGKMGIAGADLATNQQINSLIFNKSITYNYSKFLVFSSTDEHNRLANGNVVLILNSDTQSNIKYPVPPLQEQKQIAVFLDKKTSQIDELIEKKKRMIELLKEERTAMINQAVTKGLDPNTPIKDSGVEWLGEIPKHWEMKKLFYICYMKGRIGWQGLKQSEFTNEGPYLITGMNFKDGKINWEEVYHITEERFQEAPEIQLRQEDVLMTKDGTIGKLLYVDCLPDKASLNSHLLVLRALNKDFLPLYLYYQLQSDLFKNHIELNKTGTTFFGITQDAASRYKMILPPIKEQKEIVNFIKKESNRIDTIISKCEKEIDLLQEYKTALISEAVTGKIDVREEKV